MPSAPGLHFRGLLALVAARVVQTPRSRELDLDTLPHSVARATVLVGASVGAGDLVGFFVCDVIEFVVLVNPN